MQWINYHHLIYFYKIAELGSVTKAAQELRLSQPTLSAQLKSFEENLQIKLFDKAGRNLKLTGEGQLVYKYAHEIFSLGQELQFSLAGKDISKRQQLKVGVADTLPKMIVSKLLSASFEKSESSCLICYEGAADRLLAELALQELHLVISDYPVPPHIKIKAFNHYLGAAEIALAASRSLKIKKRSSINQLLQDYPIFLPVKGSALRSELDVYFDRHQIKPLVKAEFQDSALMKASSLDIPVLVPVPAILSDEVSRIYGLKVIAKIPKVREPVYLISIERQVRHPAIAEIVNAGHKLFKTSY